MVTVSREKFWEILESYSPDYLGVYRFTLADLQEADPARYEVIRAQWKDKWEFGEGFEEWFDRQKNTVTDDFELDTSLCEEMKQRLAPFHLKDHIIQVHLTRERSLGYPFTKVSAIARHAQEQPKHLVLPQEDRCAAYELSGPRKS